MSENRELTGNEAVELIWPLGQVFRPRMDEIKAAGPDPAFDAAADRAIEAIIESADTDAWERLPIEPLRVLWDRFTKALAAWQLMGNTPIAEFPADVDEGMLQAFVILELHSERPHDRG